MGDSVPIRMDVQCPTYSTTTYHQYQSPDGSWRRAWRPGSSTDTENDQSRPASTGPGRGPRRSAVDVESAGGVTVRVGGGERGVSSAGESRWDGHQWKGKSKDVDLAIKKRIIKGSSGNWKSEQTESDSGSESGKDDEISSEDQVKQNVQPNRPASENLLKPEARGQVGRHLSDGSSSTDSGCSSCSCNLKELHEENQGLRTRVKAVETITDVFEKTKQELETEKSKNAKLDIALGNLQSRLYQVGCDTAVDLAEHEIFIPGHDRAFVNSLISENGKLQRELRELRKSGGDVETKAKLETTAETQQQLRELQEQLDTSEAKIKKLENLHSPDDAKTAKIVHLEDAFQRASKELKNAEDMCKVLTSETARLQSELATSQNQLEKAAKDVALWKERAEKYASKVTEVSSQKMEVQKQSSLNMADRVKIAEGQVQQLDKENSRLTEQLREVIGMNTRWQRYNEQRETHVLKLTKTNQHQQSKITVLEQQHRDLEQTINGLNAMLQNLKEEQRKGTDAAILSLEHRLAQREDRISELAEEVSALKMYIQNSQDEKGVGQRQEDRDLIQTLQQQVKIYRDDFEQERSDRERIQGNNEILRHRLHDTSRQLAALEHQNALALPNFTSKIAGSAQAYQPQRRLVARGISRPGYGSDEETYLPEDVEIDAHDEPDGPGSTTEPLQCPRCAQEFVVADHSLFMRHVGICLDQ